MAKGWTITKRMEFDPTIVGKQADMFGYEVFTGWYVESEMGHGTSWHWERAMSRGAKIEKVIVFAVMALIIAGLVYLHGG